MSCVQVAAFSRKGRKRQWQSRSLPIIESLPPHGVTDCQKYPIMRNSGWRVVRTSLPVHHVATINVDGLALFGGEEDGHGGDILGLLPAIERHELLDLVGRPFLVRLALGYGLPLVPGLPDRAVERGLDHARAERVDPHAMRRQILGGALGEVDQPGLRSATGGGSVCEPIWPATEEMNSSVPAPACTSMGANAWATCTAPMRLTRSTGSQSAGLRFQKGNPNLSEPTPTAKTTWSQWPKSARTASAARRTAA